MSGSPQSYEVGLLGDTVVAAFGFSFDKNLKRGRVSWIMISSSAHGSGVGSKMMNRVVEIARRRTGASWSLFEILIIITNALEEETWC